MVFEVADFPFQLNLTKKGILLKESSDVFIELRYAQRYSSAHLSGCLKRIGKQHGYGHLTHAARNRCKVAGDFTH